MNSKEYWIGKLTSRKFLAAITGFVTAVLVALKIDELVIEQVIALTVAGATLIAYIIGEGWVDASREKAEVYYVEDDSWEHYNIVDDDDGFQD